jgi:amino acid permease
MFSRDAVLGGHPARRASTLLFAIESRTAALVRSNRVNRAAYVGDAAAERERAFLAAMAGGRGGIEVRIQDIEAHAPGWADLVPAGPDVRAAIARLLGSKYRFTRELTPRIRAALALDDDAVADAFQRLHGVPLSSIYADRLTASERGRWFRARIARRFDELPSFWIAYFLALTETIGEGILIVPVAMAGIGPIPAVFLLVVLGLVNVITLAGLAEAVTRNGSMRYGTAYFGRLVGELLGPVAASAQSVALGVFNVVVLFAYFLGFASVFAGATGIPEGVWVALLFAINVFYLRKESLDDTIASAIVIGVINLALVGLITVVAATRIDPSNLAYADVPILNGRSPDAATVGLVFGVVLVAFFGHTSVANASKLILARDPGGRSLLWGNVAALATVIALYSVAVVAIGGALGPEPLVATRGTAITPLANVAGPIVNVLGSIYVVLAIGLGSIYVTLGVYNQVIELIRRPGLAPTSTVARLGATRRRRLLVGFAPVVAVVVVLEVLLALDADWFAGPIGYVGVLAVPLVAGVFPMLLLAAARRKGEYVPAAVIGFIGRPVTVAVVGAVFLAGVFLHALVIWDEPAARVAALAAGVLTVALIGRLIRTRRFRPRSVIELRLDDGGSAFVSVTTDGRGVVTDRAVSGVVGPGQLSEPVTVDLEPSEARELRIWSHRVTADRWSSPVPVSATVTAGGEAGGPEGTPRGATQTHAPTGTDALLVPLDGRATEVTLRVLPPDPAR